jgi:hypothetical protein
VLETVVYFCDEVDSCRLANCIKDCLLLSEADSDVSNCYKKDVNTYILYNLPGIRGEGNHHATIIVRSQRGWNTVTRRVETNHQDNEVGG